MSVISYSDKSWNTGNLYKKLGFNYINSSAPGYQYTKDYVQFKSRQYYQKHKLIDILENYDPTLSEWENLQIAGFDRIWDCGNDVFIWINSNII